MPGKEMESEKRHWPAKRQRGKPNRKQGSELWGSCVTAWFRYGRPPASEVLRKRQNRLPLAHLLSHHMWETGRAVRIRLGRVRKEGAGQQRGPGTR